MEEKWTRRKGEQSKGYALFCIYKDLGPKRSLKKVVENAPKWHRNGTTSINTIKKHSVKWNWVERATAYDDYLDNKFREENEKKIIQMRREQVGEVQEIRSLLITLKKEYLNMENVKNTTFNTPGSLIWFMEKWMNIYATACMIEQDALGEPDGVMDREKRREEFVKLFAEIYKERDKKEDGKEITQEQND